MPRMSWIDYKHQIPIPEIQALCDMAMELENQIKKVKRGIRLGFVYPEDFMEMQSLMKRLIFNIAGVLRKYSKGSEKDVEELIKSFSDILAFSERDKLRMAEELRSATTNYPWLSFHLERVEEILYAYLKDVLEDVLAMKKFILTKEFILSAYNRRGITPSRELIKSLEEEEEGEE